MKFADAMKKATLHKRRIRLKDIQDYTTVDDINRMEFAPPVFLSDEWEVEPREKMISEMDARASLKLALRHRVTSNEVGYTVEECVEALFG